MKFDIDVHGTKLNGRCERCDNVGEVNCLIWTNNNVSKNMKLCNKCLWEEFSIELKPKYKHLWRD